MGMRSFLAKRDSEVGRRIQLEFGFEGVVR